MAITLPAKSADEVIHYSWLPSFAEGDSLSSYTLNATNCTIADDSEADGGVSFFVSDGTAGTVGIIAATAITNDGETLEETFYLPVVATTLRLGNTVRDVCDFALRKVVGNGNDADADELADAIERLNDMLAAWKATGADVGAILPLTASNTLYVRDEFLSAIKYNLKLAVHEHYGEAITPADAMMARQGLSRIKNALLPVERQGADYY